MTIAAPYLKDADGNTLQFPSKFYVRSESLSRRSNLVQLPYVNISKETADGCFNPRRIDVSGILYARDEETANALLDAINAFSYRKGVELWFKGRRIRIDKLLEMTIADSGKIGFLYNISIGYLAADPFWYSEEKTEIISGFPHNFDVGGTADTMPVITINVSSSGSSITLTVNDQECHIAYSFTDGDAVEIDSYNGIVKINGNDAIALFSGLFPKLMGGKENIVECEGPTATMTIQYSEAYI
jgi:phage-related protein